MKVKTIIRVPFCGLYHKVTQSLSSKPLFSSSFFLRSLGGYQHGETEF